MKGPMAKLEDQLEEAREEARWLRDVAKISAEQFVSLRHLKLTRSDKTILYALETSRTSLTQETLRRRMDVVLQRSEESSLKSVEITICRLRKKLGAHDPPIKISTEWGCGYYLDDENKKRLQGTRK